MSLETRYVVLCLDELDSSGDAARVKLRPVLIIPHPNRRGQGRQGKVEPKAMAKTTEARTYEEALAWLRDHGFDTTDAPGTSNRVFLRKYNVSAAIQKTPEDGVKIFAYPGYLIGSEISKLVNRGYQQFLKTS